MKARFLVAVLAAMFAVAQAASGGMLTWTFGPGGEFSGSGGVLDGSVVVTIDDNGTAGSVDVTVDTTGIDAAASDFITGLFLNIDESQFDPTQIVATYDNTSGPQVSNVSLDKIANSGTHKADGDGTYDIVVEWGTNAADRFGQGQTDTVTLTLAGITASDFNFLSQPPSGGNGFFYAALRAQGLQGSADGSGWFSPIPEPSSLAIWLLVGACALGVRRRIR